MLKGLQAVGTILNDGEFDIQQQKHHKLLTRYFPAHQNVNPNESNELDELELDPPQLRSRSPMRIRLAPRWKYASRSPAACFMRTARSLERIGLRYGPARGM